MIRECMRQGAQGAAWDLHLYMKEFDLPLDKTSVPLKWFHGEKDTNVPIAVIRRLASEQPNIQLTTYQDEAHLSTLCNHIDEISHALVKN
jgi:pimeloyl-ACP methyl ester carboxylesterase